MKSPGILSGDKSGGEAGVAQADQNPLSNRFYLGKPYLEPREQLLDNELSERRITRALHPTRLDAAHRNKDEPGISDLALKRVDYQRCIHAVAIKFSVEKNRQSLRGRAAVSPSNPNRALVLESNAFEGSDDFGHALAPVRGGRQARMVEALFTFWTPSRGSTRLVHSREDGPELRLPWTTGGVPRQRRPTRREIDLEHPSRLSSAANTVIAL